MKFKHPFTAVVAGPTSCGKTSLVRDILGHFQCCTTIDKTSITVLWCYGQWQNCYENAVSDLVNIKYHDGVPTTELLESTEPNIVILDDLMFEIAKDHRVAEMFTTHSHHYGFSVFFLTQNITSRGKGIIEINRNTKYLIMFKNPRDGHAVNTVAQQVLNDNKRHFKEAFEDATSKPYGYLVVDCHSETPKDFRLKTNIISDHGTQADVYSPSKADVQKLKTLFDVAGTSDGHHQ